MELRQLEYFVTVAEEASFTKAASRLFVAQPGVSAQIRRLKRELGEELFDRSGQAVRLTKVGTEVLPYARAALESTAGIRLTVDELTGKMRGYLAIGTVPSCPPLGMPDMLANFHKAYPAVEISLMEGVSSYLVEELQQGRLDIAFLGLPLTTPPGLEVHVIADERISAAMSPDDSLAGEPSVTLHAIKNRDMISLPSGSGVRACLDDACGALGFQPRIAFEATDPSVLAQFAIRGLGLAILPESVAMSYSDDLHISVITHPRLRTRLALAWRAQAPVSPAGRAFRDHARAALTGHAGIAG